MGRLLFVVVFNPFGDVVVNGESLSKSKSRSTKRQVRRGNTALSAVITDTYLDRNQLQRLAMATHTALAQSIVPFHTPSDGDIPFAVSTVIKEPKKRVVGPGSGAEMELMIGAGQTANGAVASAVLAANGLPAT